MHKLCQWLPVLLGLCSSTVLRSASGSFDVELGVLPLRWNVYANCVEAPEWQIHVYNLHLTILRQSACTDYEAPFLYLLFGKEKALLLDSGSRNGNVVPAVKQALNGFSGELIITHSHGHEDHVWGDDELRATNYTVIPATVKANADVFHIRDSFGHVDLGDRPIDVIEIPGHEVASLAFYDSQTGILFSGDSLYPGRLYIADWPSFVSSNRRLVNFTKGKVVTHILGAHIEQMRTPYRDCPVGSIYQPDEHQLELSRAALLELQEALDDVDGPTVVRMRDYTLCPVPISNCPSPVADCKDITAGLRLIVQG